MAAAGTRAQARDDRGNRKPPKVKGMILKMVVNKEELIRLQEEGTTLPRFKEVKETWTRKEYVISYEKRGGIWYRVAEG